MRRNQGPKMRQGFIRKSDEPDDDEEREDERKGGGTAPGNLNDKRKKLLCCFAYFFGILFFLPLIFYPSDEFSRSHANQSLIILIMSVAVGTLCGILDNIPVIGFIFRLIGGVFSLVVLIACIFGIISVCKDENADLPLIGNIRIIR